VGDVLGIDIVAGKRAGMFSILVLTGVSQKEDLKKGPIEPDLVLNSIHDLTAYL
jgi:NagD protein